MPKKREDALNSLMQSMQDNTITEAPKTKDSYHDDQNEKKKPNSRKVSNIPWYPKSSALKKELKLLALHENTTLTGLIDEGITMVLEKRGKNINDYI